ncbi:TPA: hypothetical protein JD053_16660 [Klebsiella michiganensis]|uniref:hypothetical protein n=1 Tax=Klebsiella pneumoniae TaxID=573 RepID=UPI000D1BBB93|nr:hypothetical protein [Klebsiella pneumoniae]HAU5053506.1 hypothetical protein [Klebsiella michiganensis]HCF8051302.1 hypothetical protein [Klebsiella pneumoniae]
MADWWLPMPMLTVLARIKRGDVLIGDRNGRYYWKADKKRCSSTAKALVNRGLICQKGFNGEMSITPSGRNELASNYARIPDIS